MQILIIRHASAEERSTFAATGKSDDRRPLTDEGRRKMTEVAKGLRALVPHLDVIAASPLVRAQQTAAIVAKAYRIADVETTSTLTPDAQPAAFAKWAQAYVNHDVVAVVGHEPHLGTLVTWLLSGRADSHVVFKKGGACLVECDGAPGLATGRLHWLHTPATLRRMAEQPIVPGLLVDTGSELSWVPGPILESLLIERVKTKRFRQASGTVVERWTGEVRVHAAGTVTPDEVVFGEPDDLAILGSRTLEGLNLMVDPVGKRLVDSGPAPAAAA